MKFEHCVAYSFGKPIYGDNETIQTIITPGPGQYFPTKYTLKNPPGLKMGTGGRQGDTLKKTPGVGEYAIPISVPGGPMYSMKGPTGGEEMWKKNCSPGPAQYNPRYKSGAPSYSLGSRPDTFYNKHPGPGNYNIRTSDSLKAPSYMYELTINYSLCYYSFGSEPKGNQTNLNNPNNNISKYNEEDPGPGNYNPNNNFVTKSHPKFSFGNEPRGNQLNNKSPGPGTYAIKPFFGNEGPNTLMVPTSQSFKQGYLNDMATPGPGQYNSSLYNKPNCPGFKMGSSMRDGSVHNTRNPKRVSPGPCDYSADNALNNTLKNVPRWGIGLTSPTNVNSNLLNKTYTPGPGKYNTSQNMGRGPKYSLGARNEPNNKWLKSIPGPGQYNNATLYGLSKNPTWKLGTEPRADDLKNVLKDNYPGPGHYTIDNSNKFGYKFDQDHRMKDSKKLPVGPGFYRIPCSIVDVNSYTRESGKFDPQFKYV